MKVTKNSNNYKFEPIEVTVRIETPEEFNTIKKLSKIINADTYIANGNVTLHKEDKIVLNMIKQIGNVI